MMEYRAGIDVGSTTVKLAVLDENNNIVFGVYRRHMAQCREVLAELLKEAAEKTGIKKLKIKLQKITYKKQMMQAQTCKIYWQNKLVFIIGNMILKIK